MAAPQLQEIQVKNPTKVLLTFDQSLDTSVNVPLVSFSINYGRIPLTRWDYRGTSAVVLTLDRPLSNRDKIEVNYQPPENVDIALRAPVADGAAPSVIRRNIVRAFFKVPALVMLRPSESEWNEMSNLGVSSDGQSGGDQVEDGQGEWDDICSDVSGNGGGQGGANGGVGGGYGNYPIRPRPNPRTATPDDFILAYGLREAIQISNLDDGDATQPNSDKIWMAIQDACALIDNYIVQASRGGRLLISSNRRRTALIIARYYLDSARRREDVKNDYERCITEMERARTMEDVIRPDPPWWADPCNRNRGKGVRSWRIPQVYNGISGKGLSGWWADSGAEDIDDWRYDRTNSETNNNDPNWRPLAVDADDDSRAPRQPADDGGTRYSGSSGTP
jgi:phage gp36-like protein